MPYRIAADIKTDTQDRILRAGQTLELRFRADAAGLAGHHRLYMTCEDRMHYIFKDEPYGHRLYMLIEDALSTELAQCDRYCLDLSEPTPRPYPKRAAKLCVWPPCEGIYELNGHTQQWRFGVYARADDLRVEEGGYLRLRLERWERRPGVSSHETGAPPDEVQTVEIPAGSYGYTDFGQEVRIDDARTACVLVTLESLRCAGQVCFERPYLRASTGANLLPAFDLVLPTQEELYRGHAWIGQNLSKKEWPRLRMELNGRVFYEAETFLRIHRYAPVEIDIPQGLLQEENLLRITYCSRYHDPVPLAIRTVRLLEKERAPFHIHACPEAAVAGREIPVLIETEQDGLTLTLEGGGLSAATPLTFPEKGLHVLRLRQQGMENGRSFTLSCGGVTQTGRIARTVLRPEDHVVSGSGDMIYIDNSDLRAVSDYLEWVFANGLSSLLTIRPVYRWGGQRTIEPRVWALVRRICSGLDVDYVHMTDGRDLPGIQQNPPPELLAGPHFLGGQLHERDGQLFYWGEIPIPVTEAFYALAQRMWRESPQTTENTFRTGNVTMRRGILGLARNTDCPADMKAACLCALDSLRALRGGYPRHTGPTVMFKYFYQAGFSWTGAETMDGSMEPQLAFLRGAARAFGKPRFGVHHALQWSTQPHDTQERYRRYLLADLIAYMQGVTDINTEEGLWFLEAQYAYHDRFSAACTNHADRQRSFLRFVRTHSRTGRYETPIAFLHGRFDGWCGYGGSRLFGMPHLHTGVPEDSWQLLHVFYPLCRIRRQGFVNVGYIPEDSGKPFGCYSGTPNGNADVIPVENGRFEDYRLLVFAGYNAAVPEDLDRLLQYVQGGGRLLFAWPHVSETTNRADIEAGRHRIADHALLRGLTDGPPRFETDGALTLCSNLSAQTRVLQRTPDGRPLAVTLSVGAGELILVNCLEYPGDPQAFPVYEALLTQLAEEYRDAAPAAVLCGTDVEHTQYVQADGSRQFYLTPVDWYRSPEPKRQARLRVGAHCYDVLLPFGSITKIVVNDGAAAWPEDDAFEVLSVSAREVVLQGAGSTVLCVGMEGVLRRIPVTIGKDPVVAVPI